MREIKFRGYDGIDWIYGMRVDYDKETDTWYMIEKGAPDDDWMMVGNVGQYTGLKDKNGTEIYEGDVVKGHWWERGKANRHIGRVAYVMNAFKVRGVKQYLGMDDELNPSYEIIGNIYENPELLEDEK